MTVLSGVNIVGLHNRTIHLDSFLRQQRSHGRGCAEVAIKRPECLSLPELAAAVSYAEGRPLRAALWHAASSPVALVVLRALARGLDTRGRAGPLRGALFAITATAWFRAGLRDAP